MTNFTEISSLRASTQPLLPGHITPEASYAAAYHQIPYHALGENKIFYGYGSLATWIAEQKTVLIDGYVGVFYESVYKELQKELSEQGYVVNWHFTSDYLRVEEEIEMLVKPYLGTQESVWGKKTNINLRDFFKPELFEIRPDDDYELNIVIGIGAGLLDWSAPIAYFDIPKNEIQYRMRAGAVYNLGKTAAESAATMYKRSYFVDWVVADRHRNALLNKIEVIADGQWFAEEVSWLFKDDLISGLTAMSRSFFRVRPWFEKGSWGGQWMKQNIQGLNADEVNYAWSFELITPENGLVFESDGHLLEVSFDFLMLYHYKEVIGKHAEKFGPYFPIRFDFLDTFDGGNLSIQCHPSKPYIIENFGESITQDETYYILECKPGAQVYLGFQDDIDPDAFREALEDSQANSHPIDVTRFVQSFPSHKHDLFLIPNGTVHSSGVNNMVLEISATPYIFTFKMYDWLSLDLNGQPRPINIDHAFKNLKFERKGAVVEREHIAHPVVIEKGTDWELVHLPTHPDHFYDVHRIEFDTEIEVETNDSCQVLMLVEGEFITLSVEGGKSANFAYAETFIVPAATGKYTLINRGAGRAKVIKAFIKEETNI